MFLEVSGESDLLLWGNRLSYLARGSCSGIGDWRVRPSHPLRRQMGTRSPQSGEREEREEREGQQRTTQSASNATLQLHHRSDRRPTSNPIQTDRCLITVYHRHRTFVVHLPFPAPSPLNAGGLFNRNHDAWGEIVFQ